jgi:hypothetical protein
LRCAIPPAKLDHNPIFSKKPEKHVAKANISKAPKEKFEVTSVFLSWDFAVTPAPEMLTVSFEGSAPALAALLHAFPIASKSLSGTPSTARLTAREATLRRRPPPNRFSDR